MCSKQFMMCLEDTWFVAAFYSTPMHDPGLKRSNVQLRSVCARVPVYYLASSVVVVGQQHTSPLFNRRLTGKIRGMTATPSELYY